jgi:hypothetical protein
VCITIVDVQRARGPNAIAWASCCEQDGIVPKAPQALVAATIGVATRNIHNHPCPARKVRADGPTERSPFDNRVQIKDIAGYHSGNPISIIGRFLRP